MSGAPAQQGTGAFAPTDKPLTLQDRFNQFKTKSAEVAAQLRERSLAASQSLRERDWSKQQEALTRVKTAAAGAAEKAAEGSTWLWLTGRRNAEHTLRKLRGDAVSAMCKHEANTRPCPRIVLTCCTALVTGSGLDAEGLFREPSNVELIHFILNSFEDGNGVFLPPPGTSPHILANVLKQFFMTLPEPLLTYRALPWFIEAGEVGADTAGEAPRLLMELPAADLNALWLLLETLSRVASNAAVNEMAAHDLATVFAPIMAWLPPPKPDAQGGSYSPVGPELGEADDMDELSSPGTPQATPRTELNPAEHAAVARVLEYYIVSFQALSRRVYWTPSGQPALLPE